MKRIPRSIAFLFCPTMLQIIFYQGCTRMQSISQLQPSATVPLQRAGSQDIPGQVIWVGKSNGLEIKWTTVDLFVQNSAGTERIWRPLVESGLRDFAALLREPQSPDKRKAPQCSYEREFKVISIVGDLVSFQDQYSDDCGGARPSADTRFTAIDVSKAGAVMYKRESETPMMNVDLSNSGKIAKLTDYFPEDEILRALLADKVIQKSLSDLNYQTRPIKLADLPELFAVNGYELDDTEFELRPDFLTRFAFHHIEGEKVVVRVGLPPHTGANRMQHQQLSLLLTIPESLREQFSRAASTQGGFLMKDSAKVVGEKTTTYRLRTD